MKAKFINENIEFKRGKDPKNALGIGRIKKVRGDRGYGIYEVRLIKPYEGEDKDEGEIIWEAEDIKTGKIVYVVEFNLYNRFGYPDIFGEIDPFVNTYRTS